MFKLFSNAYSTCSQKVRLVLAEKEIDWEDVQISFKDNEQYAPWYLKLNPNGVVPSLQHDDTVVIDSSVIMEYLDEAVPQPAMSPATPAGPARSSARGYVISRKSPPWPCAIPRSTRLSYATTRNWSRKSSTRPLRRVPCGGDLWRGWAKADSRTRNCWSPTRTSS
jgi:hypothetical protein